jgi:hypothetical protein
MAIAGVRHNIYPPVPRQPHNNFTPQAVLHRLATHTLALAFFATHYGSLTDDYAYHPNIRNMHMKTLVDDDKREVSIPVLLRRRSHLLIMCR